MEDINRNLSNGNLSNGKYQQKIKQWNLSYRKLNNAYLSNGKFK